MRSVRRSEEPGKWLRQRQLYGDAATPDEARAKARDEWLKLRKHTLGVSRSAEADLDSGRATDKPGLDPEIDDDLDT